MFTGALRKSQAISVVVCRPMSQSLTSRGQSSGLNHSTKAKAGRSENYIASMETQLRRAVAFFGEGRELTSIRPAHVRRWTDELRQVPNRRGGTLSEREHLNALSNLYRRAQSEEAVPPGYNPVAALVDNPTGEQQEADWLEIHEAALLLEAARTYEPSHRYEKSPPIADIYSIVTTFLLTGGRKSEVLGLDVEDVSFDRKTVTFRPNAHRRLKTNKSRRSVPLWLQLEEVQREHVFGGDSPRSGLLFPSPYTGKMMVNLRGHFHGVGKRVGFGKGRIRTKLFRHTYTAARLQTLDNRHPVSLYTVSRELGHSSTRTTERIYSHLGEIRHRREVVE